MWIAWCSPDTDAWCGSWSFRCHVVAGRWRGGRGRLGAAASPGRGWGTGRCSRAAGCAQCQKCSSLMQAWKKRRIERQNMWTMTYLGTKVGFLWGLSVPDLEDLDLRKTRRSRTGSGLGRWHRKSGTVISLKVKLEEDPSVQKNRPPTLCSVPHIRELPGQKGKCQCLWQGNEPTSGEGFSKQTSCWHTTRPKPSWAGLHKLLKWILDKPARLILRFLSRFSSKFIIFVHFSNNISWHKQIECLGTFFTCMSFVELNWWGWSSLEGLFWERGVGLWPTYNSA